MSHKPRSKTGLGSSFLLIFLCLLLMGLSSVGHAAKLKKRDFNKFSESKSVVLLSINWGRTWGCGSYENAQLTELNFERVKPPSTGQDKFVGIVAESPSRLFVDPVFLGYGFLVDPGMYAFSGWTVKVADPGRKAGHVSLGRDVLIDDENYPGGTFSVAAGEIIYIGHFGLDCSYAPMPWRYYAEGDEYIEELFSSYKSKYKFLRGKKIIYRLLETEKFGTDPALQQIAIGNHLFMSTEFQDAIEAFELALDMAESAGNQEFAAIAQYSLGRAHGHACNFDEAESWFIKSIALRKSMPDSNMAHLSQNLFETARLYVSHQDWSNARHYYDQAMANLDKEAIRRDDPVGYAEVLTTYQLILNQTDDQQAADSLSPEIAVLRENATGKEQVFYPQPFPENCQSETPES